MAKKKNELTEKELRFCQEHAADPNAVQAYLRSYPHCSYNTAHGNAHRMLRKPAIQAELKAARKEFARRARVNAVRVLRDLANVAHADPRDVLERGPTGEPQVRDWDTITPAARKTIQKVKVKRRRLKGGGGPEDVTEWEVEEVEVTFKDSLEASDKLCKHLGLTKDGAAVEELLKLLSGTTEKDPPSVPADGTGGGGGTASGGADEPIQESGSPVSTGGTDPVEPAPGPDAVPG